MMHRSFSTSYAPCLLGVSIACLLVLSACEGADSLDTIRERQASGDVAETIEPLRELLSADPADGEANFLYGRALVSTGQLANATWPLRQAMQDSEWLLPAGLLLAHTALLSGDFNEVVEVTTQILEEQPEQSAALLFRAQANAHWKKDPEAALADADRVLELEPDSLEAYEPRILALVALDRHAEARESLAEAGRRLEETEAAPATLGWHCSTTAIFVDEGGEPERAREIWQDCLARHASNPAVVTRAVEFYDAKGAEGDWKRSLEVLRVALAEAPTQPVYRNALAERLRRSGEPAEGEALLLEATEVENPQLAVDAWVELARFRHAMREHGAAAEALAQAIEIVRSEEDPSPQLLFQYADALVMSGQLDSALEVAEEISVSAQRRLIRGRVAQERGDAVGALEEFDEALRVWPNNPWARYYAALAAEQSGDFDRALEEYRYSIRISVGATDARTRAARLLIAENQPLLAYQLLFFEVAKAPLEPEGETLSMYLMARVANPQQLQSALRVLGARDPAGLPRALARGAEGAADAAGPRGALALLIGAPGVDYTHPGAASALRALVRFAHAVEEVPLADAAVSAALERHPEAAVFHEIRGLHLELAGAAPEVVNASFVRAVELDPTNARALAGLGRLRLAQDPVEAVSFFDRAAVSDPSDADPELAAARAILASGRREEAVQRLDALLERHPFVAEAATELVSLDLADGVATERTLERARRATRFGGGAEEYDQLAQVYTRLARIEEAAEATARAERLRELQAARSGAGA